MLNQITTIRLPTGETVAFVDWSDLPIYSSADLLTGFTRQETDLFQYTIGDNVPAAVPGPGGSEQRTSTKRDTNIDLAGGMSSTAEFLVYAIKPEYFCRRIEAFEPPERPDLNTAVAVSGTGMPMLNPVMIKQLGQCLLVELKISQKSFLTVGANWLNSGFGPSGAGSGMAPGVATGRNYANNGLPSQEAVRTFAIPQHIGGTEKYRLRLLNPGGEPCNFGISENGAVPDDLLALITMRVYFDGLRKRPTS